MKQGFFLYFMSKWEKVEGTLVGELVVILARSMNRVAQVLAAIKVISRGWEGDRGSKSHCEIFIDSSRLVCPCTCTTYTRSGNVIPDQADPEVAPPK